MEGYFAFALLQSKIRLIDYCVQVLCSERYARPHDDDHLSSTLDNLNIHCENSINIKNLEVITKQ